MKEYLNIGIDGILYCYWQCELSGWALGIQASVNLFYLSRGDQFCGDGESKKTRRKPTNLPNWIRNKTLKDTVMSKCGFLTTWLSMPRCGVFNTDDFINICIRIQNYPNTHTCGTIVPAAHGYSNIFACQTSFPLMRIGCTETYRFFMFNCNKCFGYLLLTNKCF